MMRDADVKDYISTMLGGTGDKKVKIELASDDFKQIVKKTLDTITPYYDGRRYVQTTEDVVDLSAHDPVAIVNIYDTSDQVLLSAEDFAFGGQNIIIYNSDFTDRYASYTAYRMLYNEYNYQRSQSWKYINKKLYIHGFKGEVLIEMLVRPKVISDIENTSQACSWVKDYALALAKEIVGRKRSKYIIEGAPYVLDGDKLIQEGLQEQSELENQLGGMGGIYVI